LMKKRYIHGLFFEGLLLWETNQHIFRVPEIQFFCHWNWLAGISYIIYNDIPIISQHFYIGFLSSSPFSWFPSFGIKAISYIHSTGVVHRDLKPLSCCRWVTRWVVPVVPFSPPRTNSHWHVPHWHITVVAPWCFFYHSEALRHLRLENFLYDFKDSDFLYLGTAWQRLVSHGSPWQPMAGVRHPKIIYWVWGISIGACAPGRFHLFQWWIQRLVLMSRFYGWVKFT
jgi:serine/threonine protein kinase